MGDFRDKLHPSSPYLAAVDTSKSRKNGYRREAIELFVRGYTRTEIAEMFGKDIHTVSEIIRLSMQQLNVTSEVELVLLAYGLLDGKDFCLKLDS